MKTIFKILLLMVFIFSVSTNGQVRKIVFLEEATNASCPPCAANNPALQEFFSENFGGVISIRYHAWWPGSDPMYSLNESDNTARINYYSISGVPNMLMDGINYGVPGSADGMAAIMNDYLQNSSPVKIIVDASINSSNVDVIVKLIKVAPITQSNLRLRTGIIERMVTYASAPGSNGERIFPDVMRKLLPNPLGEPIAAKALADTFTFSYSEHVDAAWNWEDLAVVAWLQSDDTKEVIQSNISLPTYIIESEDILAEFVSTNNTYQKDCRIINDNTVPLNLMIRNSLSEMPASWSYQLYYENNPYDSISVSIPAGDTIYFRFDVNTGNDAGTGKLKFFAENLDDEYGYGFTVSYLGVVKTGSILFVDDDGGTSHDSFTRDALDNLGFVYTYVDQAAVGALEAEILNNNFNGVVWNTCWGFPAFVPSDISFLENYLNSGGNLLIAGQDIGWDIFEGGSDFQAAVDFYHNYLDADYLNDNSGVFSMNGVAGTFADGITFTINSIYSRYPEQIRSFSGNGTLFLEYTGGTKQGAIAYDAGTFKSVYIGIGFEQITQTDVREDLLDRILSWFGIVVPVELTSFTSSVSPNGVSLFWTTATEVNNNLFEIQRSIDGINFATIGFVEGNGTASEQQNYSYTDASNFSGQTSLYYRLKQVDFNGGFDFSEVLHVNFDIPKNYALHQNYPNPFNPVTTIKYELPQAANVSIKIFDILGAEVVKLVNENQEAGRYSVDFNAENIGSGIYFYVINAGKFNSVKKMILMK
jgi:hypothetical protein